MKQGFTIVLSLALMILLGSVRATAMPAEDEQSKVSQQIEMANAFRYSDFEKAKSHLDEALAIAQRINYKSGIAESYWKLGQLQYNKGLLEESRTNLEKALQIYRQSGNKINYASVLKDLCDYYSTSGNTVEAERMINEATAIARAANNQLLLAGCEIEGGIVAMKTGRFAEATAHYLSALRIGEESQNDEVVMNSCRELGNINSLQSNLPLSNDFFNRALNINKKLGNKLGMADAYCNIGSNFLSLGNYNEAVQNIRMSMDLSRELNYKPTLATNLLNMGYALTYSGNPAEAEKNLEEAAQLYTELNDKHGQAEVLNAKGFLFSKSKDYDRASSYYLEAAKLSDEIKANSILKNACDGLAFIFEKKGDFESAYRFQKRSQQLAAQLFSGDNAKMVTQLQLNYEFDKQKEQQRIQQKLKDDVVANERKISQFTIIGLIIFFLMAVGIAFAAVKAYRASRESKLLLQEKNELITRQKEKAERILSEIIPVEIEEQLQASASNVERFATVMFIDFKNFTKTEELFSPIDLMDELDIIFKALDDISKKYQLETLKTLSDGYLCIGGLNANGILQPEQVINAGIKVQQFMDELMYKRKAAGKPFFEMKIGIHSGVITGGIVGVRTLAADIWGETVQTASLIEKLTDGGEIKLSASTYELIKSQFETVYAGQVKCGKHLTDVYQLVRSKAPWSTLDVSREVQQLIEKS
ncbi:MAG: tetratricopeptide repeat protein [Chitinophagales bacterium]